MREISIFKGMQPSVQTESPFETIVQQHQQMAQPAIKTEKAPMSTIYTSTAVLRMYITS